MSYDAFFERAVGFAPYPWQRRIAKEGLPEFVDIPTGAGKTAAIALAWCWRRQQEATYASTPRRLVWALPMRALVTQTVGEIRRWLTALGLGEQVGVHVLMGGGPHRREDWFLDVERDAVIVGTIDMLLSRALNRGYVSSMFTWPVEFGVLNNDCHWVFDEVQLLGPAAPTSRQLQAFRDVFGTQGPTSSTWMSATLDRQVLDTVDNPVSAEAAKRWVTLGDDDRVGGLASRLDAPKLVEEITGLPDRGRDRALAAVIAQAHRPGTLTLAIVNTVKTSQGLWRELDRLHLEAEVCLLHARFRAADRERHEQRLLAAVDPAGPGRIAVCTQVVEAGVDCSAAVLITEAAPWPSIIQRAGRCNRDGHSPDARLLWVEPARPAPYDREEVALGVEALRSLEGRTVTAESIRALDVRAVAVVHPVLRRRDLMELFDTAPDLTGNLVDVSHLIRALDESDAYLCWRAARNGLLTPEALAQQDLPRRDELCQVPIGDLRGWADGDPARRLFWHDHVRGEWVRAGRGQLWPGQVYVVDCAAGGYDESIGWEPGVHRTVLPVAPEPMPGPADADADVGADPASFRRRRWVRLLRHLADVREEASRLVVSLELSPDDPLLAAVIEAARLHDAGKAHSVFQDTMCRAAPQGQRERVASQGPWAKSAGSARHSRPAFRHELVSALQVLEALEQGSLVVDSRAEPDLIVYLVGAHHGRIRMGIRALPRELESSDGHRVALGVIDGERVPEVEVPDARLPSSVMRLDLAAMGRNGDAASWTERALGLLERWGPFRIGYAEALVRIADWRASAAEERGPDDLADDAGAST